MNTVNPEKKEAVMRSLAVLGLIGIICLIAWLSVQVVKIAPAAFTSLASIAQGISDYEDTIKDPEVTSLEVNQDSELVDSGKTTTLRWNTTDSIGNYAFYYNCTDGVSISVANGDGIRIIDCDTSYNLGKVDSITLNIESIKPQYTDITYTVTLITEGENTITKSGNGTITVINKGVAVETETPADEPASNQDDTVNEPSVPAVTPAPKPTYTYEYQYEIPVSDPNGKTDLMTTYVGVGKITNGRYVPGILREDSTGAVQFEVKNIGTKTSEDWTFSITLPDGSTYTSDTQKALKPNERATLTIGFNTDNDSAHTFKVEVETDNDANTRNNDFSKAVGILK